MATELSSAHAHSLPQNISAKTTTLELTEGWGAYPTSSVRYRYAKRMLDLVGTTVLLSSILVPAVAIAIAVRCSSPGPVFYREERIGRHGRTFRIWKFRSMRQAPALAPMHLLRLHDNNDVHQAHWRTQKHTTARDPRITPVGAILRRWSLDELPQLINVLRGEMSLIGPRPIVRTERDLYGEHFNSYLAAMPGLSGLWQVSGRSNIGYEQRAHLDAHYVQTWSLLGDLRILLMTIPAVLTRHGAR